jgi:hypothetical protein
MEDDRTLRDYNVKDQAVLLLQIRGVGGGKRGRGSIITKEERLALQEQRLQASIAGVSPDAIAEATRLSNLHDWSILNGTTSQKLKDMVAEIEGLPGRVPDRVAEIITRYVSPFYMRMANEFEAFEKNMTHVKFGMAVSLVSLVMRGNIYDFTTMLGDLRSKIAWLEGREAVNAMEN